jgi:nicotinamide-nucleotide amidase
MNRLNRFEKAGIITVGDEILIGQITNTNAFFIASQLNTIGVGIDKITVVGDDTDAILNVFDDMLTHYNIVLVTGGLGTTKDDITKSCICRYFDRKLTENKSVSAHLEEMISSRNLKITDLVFQQALLPENSEAIPNSVGFAPGIWIEQDGKIFVSMPGVPREMQTMMTFVLEKLQQRLHSDQHILHRHIQTFGIPEASLSEKLSEFEENLPDHIKLAYLPKIGYTSLRLSAWGHSLPKLETEMEQHLQSLSEIAGKYIFSYENKTLPELITDKLRRQKQTLGLAESCTGGYIAHLITSIPGSSDCFKGGVVAYSNEIKRDILQVKQETLVRKGAVSEETVREMAENLLRLYHVDYAIAVSGIAGPSGGTPEKPVGTVWVAVAGVGETQTKCLSLGVGRERIIRQTAIVSLCMLYKLL